ncbi:hypothetical protein J7K25_07680 [bacterium]|nr:hypothetical protein [bacterium]
MMGFIKFLGVSFLLFFFCISKQGIGNENYLVTEKTELFVDNFLIEKMVGCKKVLNQPVRYGPPVLKPSGKWETRCAFPSVWYIPEEKLFKMWYLAEQISESRHPKKGVSLKDSLKDSSFICYAFSKDGINWEKPSLGIYEFKGSKDNNIVLRHQGSHFDSLSVIIVPDEKNLSKKYRLIVFQGTWPYRKEKIKKMGLNYPYPPGHFGFTSPDGIHWEPMEPKPLVPVSMAADRTNFGYDIVRKKYIGFWKWGTKRCARMRRQSESKDLIHWEKPWIVVDRQVDEPSDTEFYGMYGFNYGSQYLGLLEVFHTNSQTIDWQLISSRDGRTWERAMNKKVFFPLGQKGSWDSGMVFIPGSPPIEYQGQLYFYYDGTDAKHNVNPPYIRAIGVAKLRKDGFVSVETENSGYLETKLLSFKGASLYLNVDATGGNIKVELIDKNGKPIKGYQKELCIPIRNDRLSAKVFWKKKKKLPNQPVKIRFYLEGKVKLYSFWSK